MTGTRRESTRFDADKKTKRMSDSNRLKRKETRKERQIKISKESKQCHDAYWSRIEKNRG